MHRHVDQTIASRRTDDSPFESVNQGNIEPASKDGARCEPTKARLRFNQVHAALRHACTPVPTFLVLLVFHGGLVASSDGVWVGHLQRQRQLAVGGQRRV